MSADEMRFRKVGSTPPAAASSNDRVERLIASGQPLVEADQGLNPRNSPDTPCATAAHLPRFAAWCCRFGLGPVAKSDQGNDDDRVKFCTGSALLVSLVGRNAFDALDEHSQNAMEIAEVILDAVSGELHADLDEKIEGIGTRVLILNEIEIEQNFRGQGLGPVVAGIVIETLWSDTAIVVCYPAPLRRPLDAEGNERDYEGDEWDQGVRKLSTLWGKLGFRHFRGGVHFIDPATLEFPKAFKKVLAEIDHD